MGLRSLLASPNAVRRESGGLRDLGCDQDGRQATGMQCEQDITEGQQAEQILRAHEARLRRSQQMGKLAHVITGSAGEFLAWSQTLPAMIGRDTAAMPATTLGWLGLLHPEDRERFRLTAIEAAQSGARAEREYRLQHGADAWIHIREVLEPLDLEPGAGAGRRWLSTLQDISAAKRIARADYHVDPGSRRAPEVLSAGELRHSREPIEGLVRAAQSELDHLYGIVRPTGYVVLLCDANGLAVEYRGNDARLAQFCYGGKWLGGVWSEDAEGTNGIGTAIAEQRPITVHQDQHVRVRHDSLFCSGAPVYGVNARLLAVLAVSSFDAGLSAQSHGLTLPLVVASARALEERLFREAFARSWIVAVTPSGEKDPAPLLAVDRDYRIVGADRRARAEFGLTQERLDGGLSLWALFARSDSLLRRRGNGADSVVGLKDRNGGRLRCALVSAPVLSLRSHVSAIDAEFLMRPRATLLRELERRFVVQPPRGGLSAGALRRICDFVESHLENNISLDALAAQAHLSVYHFARAFRHSTGVSPHRYVVEQRVKRAQQLLLQTDLPLANIASAVGFSDQGHFSRQFRGRVGTTPSSYRRTKR